jgi:N-methylhydantoinase A
MRAGIDVGGTFTDLALWDGTRLSTAKVPTTPDDQSEGVVAAVGAGGAAGSELVHGTTVATNALLERAGARTALVTDAGFEDLIEIGRQDRPSLYDVSATRVVPLVEAGYRLGVSRRLPGEPEPEEDALSGAMKSLQELAPDAVAISSLFSFLDSSWEESIGREVLAALPSAAISLSAMVAPEFREYERISTTVINAYLQPIVARYLERLTAAVVEAGVVGAPAVMRSSGGLIGPAEAARLPASIVLSGPAGGVVAAAALGTALGYSELVSFDMGGTSTDVCRITDGRPQVMFERPVGGLPNRMPSVAIHTVGAGGGSVAWIDAGGALRVGPRSAGAIPGPASYGRGGAEPTVTDANLAVGRLGKDTALGAALSLDADLARRAVAGVGEPLGLSDDDTANGILEVVEAHMERAIRVVSVEEGADPRDSVLVAFGGAGGMHATALARQLDMAGVIVPPHAGVFSALGLLLAPPRSDAVSGVLLAPGGDLDSPSERVGKKAVADLATAGSSAESIERSVDVRYRGQSHETSVPYRSGDGWDVLAVRFHEAHAERNGFARPGDPIEVVAVRAAATGRPALTIGELPEHRPSGDSRRGERTVALRDGTVDATVWWRPGLAVGDEVVGPAVIEEPEATTFIGPNEMAKVHESGSLEVSW